MLSVTQLVSEVKYIKPSVASVLLTPECVTLSQAHRSRVITIYLTQAHIYRPARQEG